MAYVKGAEVAGILFPAVSFGNLSSKKEQYSIYWVELKFIRLSQGNN